MARPVKVWYDAEGDFLEVVFSREEGFLRETNHEAVMERVNRKGEVTGFSILGVRNFRRDAPLEAELV